MTITEEAAKQLMEFIKSAGDFVAGQAPGVAREILAYRTVAETWGLYIASVVFVTGVLLFALAVFIAFRAESNYSDGYVAPLVIGLFICFLGGLFAYLSKMALIQIQIAPKMFLLEYLGNLVKSGG